MPARGDALCAASAPVAARVSDVTAYSRCRGGPELLEFDRAAMSATVGLVQPDGVDADEAGLTAEPREPPLRGLPAVILAHAHSEPLNIPKMEKVISKFVYLQLIGENIECLSSINARANPDICGISIRTTSLRR